MVREMLIEIRRHGLAEIHTVWGTYLKAQCRQLYANIYGSFGSLFQPCGTGHSVVCQ